MTSILFARFAGWRATHATRPVPTASTVADATVTEAAPPVAAQTEALDRCSAWPTRRIRCSLPDPRPPREKSR